MLTKKYWFNIGISLSIFINSLLGGKRYETLSARSYHDFIHGRFNFVWLIDKLLGHKHCEECYMEYIRTTVYRVLPER